MEYTYGYTYKWKNETWLVDAIRWYHNPTEIVGFIHAIAQRDNKIWELGGISVGNPSSPTESVLFITNGHGTLLSVRPTQWLVSFNGTFAVFSEPLFKRLFEAQSIAGTISTY